jgi:hypothetical protein
MQKIKNYSRKTHILPLTFATSLAPGTWNISRFESVSGLLEHPVARKFKKQTKKNKKKNGNNGSVVD